MKPEEKIFKDYLSLNNLKFTQQRRTVLDAFLSTEDHVSAEELYEQLKEANPGIGLATVYRTLNILNACGLAQRRQFGDGQGRYEHVFDHQHHDHLLCQKCGKITEFENSHIEDLQAEVAKDKGYKVFTHKLELYGLCPDCAIS